MVGEVRVSVKVKGFLMFVYVSFTRQKLTAKICFIYFYAINCFDLINSTKGRNRK